MFGADEGNQGDVEICGVMMNERTEYVGCCY